MTDDLSRVHLASQLNPELARQILQPTGELKPVTVERLDRPGREAGGILIRGVYGFWYQSSPIVNENNPEVFSAAMVKSKVAPNGGEVVMIIGVLGRNAVEGERCHLIHIIDRDIIPDLPLLDKAVEFTRFAALNSSTSLSEFSAFIPKGSASIPLLFVETMDALEEGRTHGLYETKTPIANRMIALGVEFKRVDAPINEALVEKLAEQDPYYRTMPLPDLYVTDLEQKRDALWHHVKNMLRERKLELDRKYFLENPFI